jgi:hypothetical protein
MRVNLRSHRLEIRLGRVLNVLEASQAVNFLSTVDARVAILRQQVDAAADEC